MPSAAAAGKKVVNQRHLSLRGVPRLPFAGRWICGAGEGGQCVENDRSSSIPVALVSRQWGSAPPPPSLVPVSILLIDAAPHPGPARPLNFFGTLKSRDMDDAFFALHRGQRAGGVRFVVSHYPTALISSAGPSRDPGSTLRTLLLQSKNVLSFVLCGHLHDLAGFAPRLHTSHSPNVMELLLADWKLMRKCACSRAAACDA